MNTPATVAVIGGRGPLASAEFVNTVYERATTDREHGMPRLVLWAGPWVPDGRTRLPDRRSRRHPGRLAQAVVLIGSLLRKDGLSSFIAGCTELHMVQKYWRRHSPIDCIDPLQIVADRIAAPIVVGSPREAGVQ